MENLFSALLITIIAFHLNACSAPKYHSTQGKDSAKLSFASMSSNKPVLSINLRGKTYSVSNDMIEKRKPGSPTNKVFKIPAEEEIILDYSVSEIIDITYSPTMKTSLNPSLGHQLDFEEHHTINRCSTKIAFTADKNKNYEIYIEESEGKVCQFYVREVIHSLTNTHKTFKYVKTKIPAS